ncbi:MAG: hypothetical protein H0T46_26005 [Deltaproteobacteria bacterium]|nr:hypothetical protein [Deltaproteobacteria bacterium]
MRALLLAAVVLAGCGSDTLGEDTAYRRLVGEFNTYEQCATSGFVGCYQTLTLCTSGRVRMELDPSRQEGKYTLDGDLAIAAFPTMTVRFDLEKAQSQQLPGRAWELVEPVVYDCP